jgi:hypothetical protein
MVLSSFHPTKTKDKDTGEEKEDSLPDGAGGGSIELRLFRWFSIQSGVSLLGNYASYTPSGEEEQGKTLTIIQIPVLVRFNFGELIETDEHPILTPFGGVGFNTSNSGSFEPPKMNIILGAELGYRGRNFGGGIAYQWNYGIGTSSFIVDGEKYDHEWNNHTLYFHIMYFLPFRSGSK